MNETELRAEVERLKAWNAELVAQQERLTREAAKFQRLADWLETNLRRMILARRRRIG
jgi:hypothetical protein